jgi:hypothetical protein
VDAGGDGGRWSRRAPRTTDTVDLQATLWMNGAAYVVEIADLSAGGMRVSCAPGHEAAEPAGFELAGPWFRFCGRARMVHVQGPAMGLQFLRWQGPAGLCVGKLVAARLRGRALERIGRDESMTERAPIRPAAA